MSTSKIRLIIKGYDHRLVDKCCKDIVELVLSTGAIIRGPVPIPTEFWRMAVHKSPFIDAKSKEHYGMRVHKRLIDVVDYNPKTIEQISHFHLPSGVSINVKS
ncbi:30S ribosomal protein S10 [Candidatus Dojkabacteria bacterium]|uniref:Small ribosomal subunit protein uS10 n=1 Tax=Candidatus Dojkabacteria bacterium TaxID=2099670 RepID=A0A3M0YZW0_9BACT|nr:MAG: 30S ribosomal protein S10 [Candidatus Dojkabacteria bacterium]